MKKVRYAVVGTGWISQIAFLPSVAQTGNSEVTALVSGNRANAEKLAKFHGIPHVYSYEQYDEMLKSGVADAVYIALPNSMHADYSIRASKAGLHALVEKPLAVTVAECEAMIAAAAASNTRLMTAYRLHSEPATLEAIDMVRRGEIGEPRFFTSSFAFPMAPQNHRLKAEHWGGPLQDLGVYCVNAMRHLFADEPVEVIAATASMPGDGRFTEVEEMIAATLRFPKDRFAHFIASFGADEIDQYRVVGTTGQIEMSSGYRFDRQLKLTLSKAGAATEKQFPHYDHFSGQGHYFSDCVLNGTRPVADGEDGLADVAIMRAIEEAAKTGKAQKISLPAHPAHPVKTMARSYPMAEKRLML